MVSCTTGPRKPLAQCHHVRHAQQRVRGVQLAATSSCAAAPAGLLHKSSQASGTVPHSDDVSCNRHCLYSCSHTHDCVCALLLPHQQLVDMEASCYWQCHCKPCLPHNAQTTSMHVVQCAGYSWQGPAIHLVHLGRAPGQWQARCMRGSNLHCFCHVTSQQLQASQIHVKQTTAKPACIQVPGICSQN
jgi:hypothetical protein